MKEKINEREQSAEKADMKNINDNNETNDIV